MLIKRVSQELNFFTAKQKMSATIFWPLRPEMPIKRSAKVSEDRLPQSLYSGPHREKKSQGGVQ